MTKNRENKLQTKGSKEYRDALLDGEEKKR